MNGHQSLVLPFSVNFAEVEENKEAVLNGLSAIQRFFDENIWSPLGADIDSLFSSGVAGATDHLCDWFASPAPLFAFETERWEEYLRYFSFFLTLLDNPRFFFLSLFFKATGRFPTVQRDLLRHAF